MPLSDAPYNKSLSLYKFNTNNAVTVIEKDIPQRRRYMPLFDAPYDKSLTKFGSIIRRIRQRSQNVTVV